MEKIVTSSQSTVDFIVEQMSQGHDTRARKMFGEFGIYCDEVFIGVICDDQLFLKITNAGKELLPDAEEAPPYAGAKPYLLVAGDVIEDADRLSALGARTAAALPPPKQKKRKKA